MRRLLVLFTAVMGLALSAAAAEPARVVLVAGRPSHGPGEHEFNAGVELLAQCLRQSQPGIEPVIVKGGWPEDESVFDSAKAILLFMDGGGGHPLIQQDRLDKLQAYMDKGVGLVCLHYAVEVPAGKAGDCLIDWIGGFYERGYSINPHWTADMNALPQHPITRGVKPFTIKDEWYFNMRFPADRKAVTSILVAPPDDATRDQANRRGDYSHIAEAKGRPEVLAWCVERPDGGRGFGFTGAHFHKNWGNDDFRTLVLNAIVWSAGLEVPSEGVQSKVTEADLARNLDPKGK